MAATPEHKVWLRVQRVAKMQLHHDLASLYLRTQPAQSSFVGVCRRAQSQLVPKVACKRLSQADGGLLVWFAILLDDAIRLSKFLLRERLHADEQPATIAVASGPLLDVFIKLPPATKIEIPNAKIRPMRNTHRGLERRQ